MKSTMLNVAAFGSVAALGGLVGAGITGGSSPAPTTAADRRQPAAPVEIRTVVVHRTERVVRHVRRRHHVPSPARAAAPAPAAAPAAAATRPVAAAVAPAAPAARAPRVVTRTSGAAAHGGGDAHEREHGEGGDD